MIIINLVLNNQKNRRLSFTRGMPGRFETRFTVDGWVYVLSQDKTRMFYGCSYKCHLSGDDRRNSRVAVVFTVVFLVIEAHGGTWFRTPCPIVVRSRSKC